MTFLSDSKLKIIKNLNLKCQPLKEIFPSQLNIENHFFHHDTLQKEIINIATHEIMVISIYFNIFDEFCLILVNIKAHENSHFKGPSSLNNRISSKLYAIQSNAGIPTSTVCLKGNLIAFTIFQDICTYSELDLNRTLSVFIYSLPQSIVDWKPLAVVVPFLPWHKCSACKNSYIRRKGNSANFSS